MVLVSFNMGALALRTALIGWDDSSLLMILFEIMKNCLLRFSRRYANIPTHSSEVNIRNGEVPKWL